MYGETQTNGTETQNYMACSCTCSGILKACFLRCPRRTQEYMLIYVSLYFFPLPAGPYLAGFSQHVLQVPKKDTRRKHAHIYVYVYIWHLAVPEQAVQEQAITASAASLSGFKLVFSYPGTRHQFQVWERNNWNYHSLYRCRFQIRELCKDALLLALVQLPWKEEIS